MKKLVKIVWSMISILSFIVFIILCLLLVFGKTTQNNHEPIFNAMLFFMGMSAQAVITFSRNIFNYSKNSDLVNQIKSASNDLREKKQLKLKEKEEAKKELLQEKITEEKK